MGFAMRLKFTDILRDETLANYYENKKAAGYQFNVRLAYYRGHYLSAIDEFAVEVDGIRVADEFLRFCINGKEFMPGELKEAYDEFWNIKQAAAVKVMQPGGLAEGRHKVKLTLMLRNPYLPQPGAEDRYTPIDSCDEKEMVIGMKGR